MKPLVQISRIIVGTLFIFSGLVKANDPLGLAYKMQEFFEVWGRSGSLTSMMHFLDQYALPFSIIIITFEIVAGAALLVGWRSRFFSWLIFLLTVFFTFLTGYALFSGKIKTCGCFGDCIPLTAQKSFIKDLVLLFLIIIILFGTKYIRPILRRAGNMIAIIISTLLVLVFQWYVLKHLPLIDCLPFKKNNNLLELRKMPANAKPDKFDYVFVYEKNGEKKEFKVDALPDSTWIFADRKQMLVEKGENNEPPIKDFYLYNVAGTDTTEAILNQPGNYYLLFIKELENKTPWLDDIKKLVSVAKQKNIPFYLVASQVGIAEQFFNGQHKLGLPVLACDATAIKTAARTNPTIYLMQGPVVINKWGKADFDKVLP